MAKLKKILHNWLKILGLESYEVKCTVRSPREIKGLAKDDAAMIDISLGEKRLEIFLNPKDRKKWNEKLILHELTHVFLYRLWEFVDELIQKGYYDPKAQDALRATYERLEDETVDRLVGALLNLKAKKKKPFLRNRIAA